MKRKATFSLHQVNDWQAWAKHAREAGYIVKVAIKGGKVIVERW